MTRVFVDTRSHRGCWVAAHAAGLFDLDVVALVAEGAPPKYALAKMRTALEKASSTSQMTVVEIPCSTVEAAGAVGGLACAGDVIVTDSAPFAHEFLQRGGRATDCFGEEYSRQDIAAKVRRFHACKELQSLGVDPYKPRPYRTSERERLLETLVALIGAACQAVPKEAPVDLRREPELRELVKPVPLGEFEKGDNARVFVDGDSCPRLATILEVCSCRQVPGRLREQRCTRARRTFGAEGRLHARA